MFTKLRPQDLLWPLCVMRKYGDYEVLAHKWLITSGNSDDIAGKSESFYDIRVAKLWRVDFLSVNRVKKEKKNHRPMTADWLVCSLNRCDVRLLFQGRVRQPALHCAAWLKV